MKLNWNQPGENTYESGLDRGVFFQNTGVGHAWNGLISVDQGAVGGEVEQYYFDGVKYLDFVASEDFQATLTAFSTPPAFAECEGVRQLAPGLSVTNQPRKTFGLSYRTGLGNDLELDDYGYKLHLVWNCTATPSPRSHRTRSDDASLAEKEWTIDSVPPPSSIMKPTAHVEINSRGALPAHLQAVEDILYGTNVQNSRLPTQTEVIQIFGGL